MNTELSERINIKKIAWTVSILYIEDIVHKKEPLTEWQIRNIHALILKKEEGIKGEKRFYESSV